MKTLCKLILPAFIVAAPAASADPVADFYRDQTVTILVSADAGGGFDIYARALQPYLSSHLPGKPTVIVKNMPGAGGIVAMNHLYNAAPKDGTVVGIVHNTVPFSPLLKKRNTRFDAREFHWVASLDRLPYLCVSWHGSKVKTFDDVLKHELVVGSTGAGSGMTTFPLLLNRMFGAKFRVVSGYKGGNNIYLAMERGEVEGRCSLTYPTLAKVHPEWLAQKKINIFAVLSTERDPDWPQALKEASFVYDRAKTDEQKAIFDLAFAGAEMDRPMPMPPGTPAGRVRAVAGAIAAAARNPAMLADFKKRGLDLKYTPGEKVAALIARIYATPPEIVDKAIDMMKAPKK
jgi:tripartite-type tricarboxylate transporter receptor subunit TctC